MVGDDAQSIYSFRAATVRNILDFPEHFSTAGEVVTLERNYRSTQPILAAANAVIELAEERFTKNLWIGKGSAEKPQLSSVRDEADQARYIVETGFGGPRSSGSRSKPKPSCSAPRIIPHRWKSSSPGGTFRSSNSAG